MIGIKTPINSAYNIAKVLGTGSVSKPMSDVNNLLLTHKSVGKLRAKPITTEGKTNMKPWIMIIETIPDLLSPIILITPNSNVFDSTLIMSNE